MKTLLLSVLLAAVAATGFAQSADEVAVRAAHQAYIDAARNGDAASLKKLFADELQYSHSNTLLENKDEAIAALVKSKSNFEVHEQTVKVYGKAATIRAKVTAHGPTGDTPLTLLQVWVKRDKQWQMIERQTTRIPAK
jgi:ketosteroid isomerase-like protein